MSSCYRCFYCETELSKEDVFIMWSKKFAKHVRACKGCLGELVFNKLPGVGITRSRPGSRGIRDDIDPWQENAIGDLEDR